MRKKRRLFFGMTVGSSVLLIGGVLLGTALATHETDHRFTVFGSVRDDKGRPLSNVRVIVVDKRIDLASTTFSDKDGYYEALLHLHNTDRGDEISVMAGEQQKTIRAEFDPEDHKAERRVQVDFGAPPSASSAEGPGIDWRYAAAAIAVLVAIVAVVAGRFRKRAPQPAQKGSKKKK